MLMSRLFSQTFREVPSDAETASHQLLMRAGFIRPLASGIFSYLPLARRAMTRIENIMREEINAIGGQEVTMPVVQPADLWQETGRWYQIGSEMGRFKDKAGRDMVLAMTHEEVVAALVRDEIRSYRQLPALIYHIQTKWRDDPRPRAGLIRVREFTMLDSYSLDAAWEGLDAAVPGALYGLSQHLPALRPAGGGGALRFRDDGRTDGARVHVPDPHRRRYTVVLRRLRLFGQPPGGARPPRAARQRRTAGNGKDRHTADEDDRRPGRAAAYPGPTHRQGGLSDGPASGRGANGGSRTGRVYFRHRARRYGSQ